MTEQMTYEDYMASADEAMDLGLMEDAEFMLNEAELLLQEESAPPPPPSGGATRTPSSQFEGNDTVTGGGVQVDRGGKRYSAMTPEERKAAYDNIPESYHDKVIGRATAERNQAIQKTYLHLIGKQDAEFNVKLEEFKTADKAMQKADPKNYPRRGAGERMDAFVRDEATNWVGDEATAVDDTFDHMVSSKQFDLTRDGKGHAMIHYNAPIEGVNNRYRIANARSDDELKAIVKDITGNEPAQGVNGQWVYWNRTINGGEGGYATIDSPENEIEDVFGDWGSEVMQTAAAVGVGFVMGGPIGAAAGLGRKVVAGLAFSAADAAVVTGVKVAEEAAKGVRGDKLEKSADTARRLGKEFVRDFTLSTMVGGAIGLGARIKNNPFSGSLTNLNRKRIAEAERINLEILADRDPNALLEAVEGTERFRLLSPEEQANFRTDPKSLIKKFVLRPDQANDNPTIDRLLALLSYLPGSAGSIRKFKAAQMDSIDQEIALLLRNGVDDEDLAAEMFQQFALFLDDARASRFHLLSAAPEKYYGAEKLGKRLYNAVEGAYEDFKKRADGSYKGVEASLNGSTILDIGNTLSKEVIPTVDIKGRMIYLMGMAKKDAEKLAPLGRNAGSSAKLEKLIDDMPDALTTNGYKRYQEALSDIIRSARSQNDTHLLRSASSLSDALRDTIMSKKLTDNMRRHMKGLGYSDEVVSEYISKFRKTTTDYNDGRKVFELSEEPTSTWAKVLAKYQSDEAGGIEEIAYMFTPGATGKRSDLNNKFARMTMDILDEDQQAELSNHIFKMLLNPRAGGLDRMEKLLKHDEQARELYEILLGSESAGVSMVDHVLSMSSAWVRAENSLMARAAVDYAERGHSSSFLAVKGANDVKRYADMIDIATPAQAERLRQSMITSLLEQSYSKTSADALGNFDGNKLNRLLDSLGDTPAEARKNVEAIIGAESLSELDSMAGLSVHAGSDLAGSMAATSQLVTGLKSVGDGLNLVSMGVFAGTTRLAAAGMLSPKFVNWVSKESLTMGTKARIRQTTETAYYIAAITAAYDDPTVERMNHRDFERLKESKWREASAWAEKQQRIAEETYNREKKNREGGYATSSAQRLEELTKRYSKTID